MFFHGKSVRSWCGGSSDRSFMVNPLSYFSFQPVLNDCFNKGRGMYYPVKSLNKTFPSYLLLLFTKNQIK